MNDTLLQTLTEPRVIVLAVVVILVAAGLVWLLHMIGNYYV
jgi:hypothetical protein